MTPTPPANAPSRLPRGEIARQLSLIDRISWTVHAIDQTQGGGLGLAAHAGFPCGGDT